MAWPLFELGQIVGTPSAIRLLDEHKWSLMELVRLHATGHWDTMSEHDQAANRSAITNGERVFSAYTIADGIKVWVITEADRSSTCVLLPEDY